MYKPKRPRQCDMPAPGTTLRAVVLNASHMMVLTWMGFTLPPEGAAYWIGEVVSRRAGLREAPHERGDPAHGEEPGAESRLLCAAPEATPAGAEGRRGLSRHPA